MMKTYLVVGSNWMAEVPLEDTEAIDIETVKTEAATRAVEALYKKRDGIAINDFNPTDMYAGETEMNIALGELLSDEIEPGCRVGLLMSVIDTELQGQGEWYISSREILENVGLPHLVSKFHEKKSVKS